MVVLGVVLNFSSMIALVGSLGLLAGVICVVAALVIGYLLGGSGRDVKSVPGWARHSATSGRPWWSPGRALTPTSWCICW